MRNLFLLLLLANLGLLGWQRWISPQAPGTDSIVIEQRSELPRLVLAEEVIEEEEKEVPQAADVTESAAEVAEEKDEADETEEAEMAELAEESGDERLPEAPAVPVDEAPVSAATIPDESAERCVSIGPFRDLTETTQAMTAMRAAGHEPRQRLTEGEVWIGHWVFLPAFESRSDARTVLNRLKNSGIADSYIVPSGEERNAVSLGVFAERDRARRRVAEISALGYAPRVADRHRSGAVYWIDTQLGAAESLEPDDIETVPGRIMRLDVIDCPSGETQIAAGKSG